MKLIKFTSVFIIFIMVISCKNENKQNVFVKNNHHKNVVTDTLKKEQYYNYDDEFLVNYPEKIKKYRNKFYSTPVGKIFTYEYYDNFITEKLDKKKLYKVQPNDIKYLFNNTIPKQKNFTDYYFYSIEEPIQGLYPITLISDKSDDQILVLFDKKGNFKNFIEVSAYYEGDKSNMISFFENDSTLVKIKEKIIINSNNKKEKKTFKQQVVIHKNGSISVSSIQEKKRKFPKTNNPNLYQVNDTILSLKDINSEAIASIIFNYPKLNNISIKHPQKNNIINIWEAKNDSLKIVIKETKFNLKKHKIKRIDNLILIDYEKPYGIDYPDISNIDSEISSIKIIFKNKVLNIPKKYFSNLYNAHFCCKDSADVYILPNNRIVIDFMGSDAAGGYRAVIFIKDFEAVKKLVFTGY